MDTLRDVLAQESGAIAELSNRLDDRHVHAVDWILACRGRTITCGVGKSGQIARKTAATLSSTGTPSLFLHAAEALHGDLGMVTSDDIVLMYSHSGESDELVQLFPALRAIGARTILITGRPESSAGRMADLVLPTWVETEACPNNLAPSTSTTVMLALSDAIAISVMTKRAFKPEDFAKFHPSGALGRRLLLKVRDVMRQGSDVSIVESDTPAIEVMKSITHAGAGAAMVVDDGRLVGLITDGDLRRHFIDIADPLRYVAKDLMSVDPTTLLPSLLAVEALEYFQNLPKKIGEIPVVEYGNVCGLLVLKDLLRSGII